LASRYLVEKIYKVIKECPGLTIGDISVMVGEDALTTQEAIDDTEAYGLLLYEESDGGLYAYIPD